MPRYDLVSQGNQVPPNKAPARMHEGFQRVGRLHCNSIGRGEAPSKNWILKSFNCRGGVVAEVDRIDLVDLVDGEKQPILCRLRISSRGRGAANSWPADSVAVSCGLVVCGDSGAQGKQHIAKTLVSDSPGHLDGLVSFQCDLLLIPIRHVIRAEPNFSHAAPIKMARPAHKSNPLEDAS